ncbi:MAG: tetratricopeptide repeat protein, partial [Treponemataceae bacterium]
MSVLLFLIISCAKPSVSASFSGNLALLDVYIEQFKMSEAVALLKKISKNLSSPANVLSVYKRCIQIGELKLGKQTLNRGRKLFPSSLELKAVYVQFLINQGDLNEAFTVGKSLEGTSYGSLVSEVLFRMHLNQDVFFSPSFFNTFIDAANITKNPIYLQNAAIIKAVNGSLSEAIELHPPNLISDQNPLFWAKLAYDAENFYYSLLDISVADNPSAEILLLKADIFLRLEKIQAAMQTYLDIYEQVPYYSPIPYLNIAYTAYKEGNLDRAYIFLQEAVERFQLDTFV